MENNRYQPLLENENNVPRMRMNNFLAISKVNKNNTGNVKRIHAKTRPGRKSTLLKLTKNVRTMFGNKKNRRTRKNRK